jgi:hypothetical protein
VCAGLWPVRAAVVRPVFGVVVRPVFGVVVRPVFGVAVPVVPNASGVVAAGRPVPAVGVPPLGDVVSERSDEQREPADPEGEQGDPL